MYKTKTQYYLFKEFIQELVISQSIGGAIQVQIDWPTYLNGKGVYFVKRENEALPEYCKELLDYVTCGDVHSNIIGLAFVMYFFNASIVCQCTYRSFLFLVGRSYCPNF